MLKIVILICLLFSQKLHSIQYQPLIETNKLIDSIQNAYGVQGKVRTQQWLKLIEENQSESHWKILHITNTFINKKIQYLTDFELWGKNDYWASPYETLGVGSGDCEDFAIAKFFTLIALGIPETQLRLMYVRQLTINVPHMVLVYFEEPNSTPLILDNYDYKIKPANARPDLRPIYSFNGSGLWMNKMKGKNIKVKNSNGISAWGDLEKRITQKSLNIIR